MPFCINADAFELFVVHSLGCKAVFLLGGSTRDEPPLAMFVRSGDVVLMAGSARQCFHGTSILLLHWVQTHRLMRGAMCGSASVTFLSIIVYLLICVQVYLVYSVKRRKQSCQISHL